MKKQILLSVAICLIGTTGLFANISHPYYRHCFQQGTKELGHDARDVRHDKRDIHHDNKDIRHDRHQRNADLRNGNTRGAAKEQHDINRDKRDRRHDVKDLHHDRKDVKKDLH